MMWEVLLCDHQRKNSDRFAVVSGFSVNYACSSAQETVVNRPCAVSQIYAQSNSVQSTRHFSFSNFNRWETVSDQLLLRAIEHCKIHTNKTSLLVFSELSSHTIATVSKNPTLCSYAWSICSKKYAFSRFVTAACSCPPNFSLCFPPTRRCCQKLINDD